MSVYKVNEIKDALSVGAYIGRGIIIGQSEDGTSAVFAYFITGRSENSRNRVFSEKDGTVTIYPFDESKVEDPSLIIYSPVRRVGKHIAVSNGDQTDTVVDFLNMGKSFEMALESRTFEPDSPNYTPRISGILNFDEKSNFDYKLSILKSEDELGSECTRQFFSYKPIAGLGHLIHTYNGDGNPIPSFTGEPKRVRIDNSIDKFVSDIWDSLDGQNRISLYAEYVGLDGKSKESRLINKNK